MQTKKISFTFLTVLTLTGAILMSLNTKRQIRTSIIINNSTDIVWNMMTKTQNYSNWNPFIRSIDGELVQGNQIKVFIKPENEDGMEFKPTLLKVAKNNELRWVGRLGFKGIFDGEHYFILERLGPNKTKLIHGENFSGILVPLLWNKIKESTTLGFKAHNQALKNLSEKTKLTAKL